MSASSRPLYRAMCTIWQKLGEQDKFGDVEYAPPVHIMCQFKSGSSTVYSDAKGREFKPKTTIWTELRLQNGDFINEPRFGDMLAIGISNAQEPVNAYPVRIVEQYDVSLFDTVPDYKIMTG